MTVKGSRGIWALVLTTLVMTSVPSFMYSVSVFPFLGPKIASLYTVPTVGTPEWLDLYFIVLIGVYVVLSLFHIGTGIFGGGDTAESKKK